MRKAEMVLRLAAYLCGVVGMVLVVRARGALPGQSSLTSAGWVLLGLMFVLFLVTYGLRFAALLRRPGRTRPPPPDPANHPPAA